MKDALSNQPCWTYSNKIMCFALSLVWETDPEEWSCYFIPEAADRKWHTVLDKHVQDKNAC